jgi:hypothetical protein
VFDADKVRAELQPTGIVLDSHRVFTQRGRRCVELQAAFASLAALRGNPLTGGARATWEFSAADHPGQVRLVYYPQGVEAWRAARAKARELAQEPDAVVQHFVASRLREIDGLDVTLNLELPGDVVAHTANLALTGKRSVQVKIRAADIETATDLLVRLAPRFEVIFTGPDFPLPAAAPAAAEAGATRTQAPDERNR